MKLSSQNLPCPPPWGEQGADCPLGHQKLGWGNQEGEKRERKEKGEKKRKGRERARTEKRRKKEEKEKCKRKGRKRGKKREEEREGNGIEFCLKVLTKLH